MPGYQFGDVDVSSRVTPEISLENKSLARENLVRWWRGRCFDHFALPVELNAGEVVNY
jgi:hypothetical protein